MCYCLFNKIDCCGGAQERVRNYIPSLAGFEHGGYSVDRCRYLPGTGERLADEFVAMLEEVHES